ncbi:hypothetical protein E2C01_043999 [Portunus trituberculatus]|uniref:Uncharacterized protein n=1 Tax=Portunus trituberculatus TaxID=210409 RepID=A0A5B7FXN0_PORTR|nr:hypothetical protein [Portunus trituberculatus]
MTLKPTQSTQRSIPDPEVHQHKTGRPLPPRTPNLTCQRDTCPAIKLRRSPKCTRQREPCLLLSFTAAHYRQDNRVRLPRP